MASAKTQAVGRVSNESVKKGSGKDWPEWIAILRKAGAATWTHQEIVAFLKKKYRLGPWWQQGVAHGFEVATGKRIDGQNFKGLYGLTATKTLKHDQKWVWKLMTSEPGRSVWLKPLFPIEIKIGRHFETTDGFFGEIRTLKAPDRIRVRWMDPNWQKPTTVQIICVKRANGTCILGIQHENITTLAIQAQLRKRWKSVLAELAVFDK